jgi:hypothetical protein
MKLRLKVIIPLIFILLCHGYSQSYDGYTLYFPQGGTKAYLIDLSGNTSHSWTGLPKYFS